VANSNGIDMHSTPSDTGRFFFGEPNFVNCVNGTQRTEGFNSSTLPDPPRNEVGSVNLLNVQSTATSASEHASSSSRSNRYLQEEGAFTFPCQTDAVSIFEAYVEWFHPCFPVLDRAETAHLLATGKLSPLLYQAIMFVGSTYCDESSVLRIGYHDRGEARAQLYERARLLFDAEIESDVFIVIQSAFLLSFRRVEKTEMRDVRYWLSIAVTLAQSHGLHRSYVVWTPKLFTLR
jgi:hypothetical protein